MLDLFGLFLPWKNSFQISARYLRAAIFCWSDFRIKAAPLCPKGLT